MTHDYDAATAATCCTVLPSYLAREQCHGACVPKGPALPYPTVLVLQVRASESKGGRRQPATGAGRRVAPCGPSPPQVLAFQMPSAMVPGPVAPIDPSHVSPRNTNSKIKQSVLVSSSLQRQEQCKVSRRLARPSGPTQAINPRPRLSNPRSAAALRPLPCNRCGPFQSAGRPHCPTCSPRCACSPGFH